MKQKMLLMACAAVLLFSCPASAGDSRNEQVHFTPGTSGTTLKESITGYQTINYKLRARAGQSMEVDLKSDNGANYFNIYEPGRGPGDEAIFVGSLSGSQYQGTLPADGEYTVQVFLMRSAARRNEKAHFVLEIKIDGAKKHAPATGQAE